MAYDPKTENLFYLRRIVTGLFDFNGRSRRSEFLVFLAAIMLVWALIAGAYLIFFDSIRVPNGEYMEFALWIPAVPLFVRRLHDQNKTGWIAIVLPALLVMKVYERAQFEAGNLVSPDLGFPITVVEGVLVITFWVLVFWPGSKGENRFGPDPRQQYIVAVR